MTTGIVVTTYNRPSALERSLPQIARLGHPILVIDDASPDVAGENNQSIAHSNGVQYLRFPQNRGLAAALNAGLAYWLADKDVEWISYFQDDVDVHPICLKLIESLVDREPNVIFTGHDAIEHQHYKVKNYGRIVAKYKKTCAGVHIHAPAKFWSGVLPIPTYALGAPKRNGGPPGSRGIGSNVDWWIVKDSPGSAKKQSKDILCLPGLVRTFYWKAEDSSWNNGRRQGEEPPLAAY